MALLTRTFLRGLLTILPVGLSLYMLYWFFVGAESVSKNVLLWIFPDIPYLPGFGVAFGVGIIFAVGVLMANVQMRWVFGALEMPFKHLPIVKSIYTALKDLATFFTPSEERRASRVVAVKPPGMDIHWVGFVTRESMEGLPEEVGQADHVAVYVPLSYQIGGHTVFIPKSWISELPMSVEDAMKMSLTAWMPSD